MGSYCPGIGGLEPSDQANKLNPALEVTFVSCSSVGIRSVTIGLRTMAMVEVFLFRIGIPGCPASVEHPLRPTTVVTTHLCMLGSLDYA